MPRVPAFSLAVVAGVFLKQERQPFGRHPPAFVADRDRHVHPVARRGDANGRRLGRVLPGVGQQVVQDLDDALPVGHHPGQVRRQVDQDSVPAAPAQEGVAGLVHQTGDIGGLGGHRQGAGFDAPGIQQVADQAPHVIGLLVNEPEELNHLGRGRDGRGAQHGDGGAFDRGQRGSQLVADHAQELGPQPLQLHQRRQVLHGDDHRLDPAPIRTDGGGVDQGPDPAPVGDLQDHLLGAHRLGGAEHPVQGEFPQADLPPVGAAAGDHLQQLLRRTARHAQGFHDPLRLPVQRHRTAAPGFEDHHPDRGGVDQGFQVRPRPLLVPVCAGVGDGRGRLRGEHQQDFLVLLREGASLLLAAQEEVADVPLPMPHRRTQEGLGRQRLRGKAEGAHVGVQVGHSQGARKASKVFEKPRPVGPFGHLPGFLRTQAGIDDVLDLPGFVDGRDHPAPGPGQGDGAVDDLAQDRLDLQTAADAQDRRAQSREAVAQLFVLPPRLHLAAHQPAPVSNG